MAGGMDLGTSSKSGKKSLDAMLNLVPFIDLMAVTIVFLIMSAVWTQLGRLQVSSAGHSPGEDTTAPQTQPVILRITEKELTLTFGSSSLDPIAITRDSNGNIEVEKLLRELREVHGQQPDQGAITLSTDDSVRYQDLVRLIDTVVKDGSSPLFPAVTVNPA